MRKLLIALVTTHQPSVFLGARLSAMADRNNIEFQVVDYIQNNSFRVQNGIDISPTVFLYNDSANPNFNFYRWEGSEAIGREADGTIEGLIQMVQNESPPVFEDDSTLDTIPNNNNNMQLVIGLGILAAVYFLRK